MRLQNDALGRMLHDALYKRLLSFCDQYTPEIPGDVVVQHWLSRLYSGDSNLHILVTLNDHYAITGHMVVDVQQAYGVNIVYCHQAEADKGNKNTIDEGMEYIDKLAAAVSAQCTIVNVVRHNKALEKKYNFNTVRSTLIKYYGSEADGDSDE